MDNITARSSTTMFLFIFPQTIAPPAELGEVAKWIIVGLLGVITWQQAERGRAIAIEREKWKEVLDERHKICEDERARFDAHADKTLELLKAEITKRDDRWAQSQTQMDAMSLALTRLADRLAPPQHPPRS